MDNDWEESPRPSLGINQESLAGKAEPYRTVLRQSREAQRQTWFDDSNQSLAAFALPHFKFIFVGDQRH
jgi:hypothetical protein